MTHRPSHTPSKKPHEKGTEPGPFGALELVAHRNEFYHDGSHYTLVILLILIVMNGFLLYAVADLYLQKPAPRYFPTNAHGSLFRIVPLNEPYLTNNELLTWVMEAATAAYSFDFVSYKPQIQKKHEYFTNEGFENYLKALSESNNLEYIVKEKMVVVAQPTGTPIILEEAVLDGRYAWRIEMPVQISYQNSTSQRLQNVILKMTVMRESLLDSPRGVGISQLVMQAKDR